MEQKYVYPESKVLRALVESRWVYKPGTPEKAIYTDAQRQSWLAEHPEEENLFKNHRNSGIVGIIAGRCDVPEPNVSGWLSGTVGIPRPRLLPIADALHLDDKEKLRLHRATLFGSSSPPEKVVPDPMIYVTARWGDLFASMLPALCATSKEPDARYQTIEAMVEALKKGELVIRKWGDVLREAETNPDILLRNFSLKPDKAGTLEQEGLFGRVVKTRLTRMGINDIADMLSFVPLAPDERLAFMLNLVQNKQSEISIVSPEAIFSPANLLPAGGMPKHQARIVSELRCACGMHKETEEVRFWYDIIREAIAERNPQLLLEYVPMTPRTMERRLGTAREAISDMESNTLSDGTSFNFSRYLDKLAELFRLSDEWKVILQQAPHRDSQEVSAIRQYRDLIEAAQPGASAETCVLNALPDWMQEVPGGARGLKKYRSQFGPENKR